MKLSIVTTLLQSSVCLDKFYERVTETAKQWAKEDYEIIFINDGSPDESLKNVIEIANHDNKVIVIELSRKFGHHKAIMTGLMHAKGDYIFLIDSDPEKEAPELLLDFANEMKAKQCDMVFGVQDKHYTSIFEKYSDMVFCWAMNKLANIKLPENQAIARLMSKRYKNALIQHQERELTIAGLWTITGFQQVAYTIKNFDLSKNKYTIRKKLSVLVNSITSFSNKPLYLIFYTGLIVSSIAVIYITSLLSRYFLYGNSFTGWTSIIASIWLLGGIIISFIGIIAIYISKIFMESKQRPYTIIREIYNSKNESLNNYCRNEKLIGPSGFD